MRRLFVTVLLLFLIFGGFAQSPFGINYQAIARDDAGQEIPNDNINVLFELREGSTSGEAIYSETHDVLTNSFGLFNLVIGQGDNASSDFSAINWGGNTYFLATGISDDGGITHDTISVVQLISVPYALHANTVSNADDADADPNNETNLSLSFDSDNNNLAITDLDGVLNVDLSSLDDDDGDPQNESIVDATLDGTELVINESGTNHTVDLSPILPSNFWLENGTGALYYTGNQSVGIGENNLNPNSTLDINGSVSYNTQIISNISLNPSATSSHFLINNFPTPFSITLPSAITAVGREYVFVFRNTVNHSIEFLTTDNTNINSQPTITFSPAHGEQVFSVISFGFEGWYFTSGL